ncbi:MAG TPA: hypothetical protein PKD26_00700 [Pyrinomonadaceae bacterium]|nr:hypothetical protein [Pyrinomonadaceae bacterium]
MKLIMIAMALIAMIATPISALACACCPEPGTYFNRSLRPAKFELDLLREFRFASKADLYMTEAGFDLIKGLDPVRPEYESEDWTADSRFASKGSLVGRVWRFELATPNGLSGSLVFTMPARIEIFKADIRDEEDRPNGPLLYKEIRLRGTVSSSSGFARPGWRRGTSYFLLFQGRGSGCDEASDFTHWRLEITGPAADYAFHGKLDAPA